MKNLHGKGDHSMRDLIHHFGMQLYKLKVDSPFHTRLFYLFVLVGSLLSATAYADGVAGKVIAVVDGNTLEISGPNDEVQKIVLSGIDSPELGQEFGNEAKKFLEKLLLSKDVTLEFTGKDRSGNSLAVVKINGKADVRIALLKEGLAWTLEKNPEDQLEAYKTWAQRKGKGLWKQQNPVPPWTYRRQQSMLQAKSR
jgi:micrococcal nuclease